ncbi:MAG: metal ABC transporter substrate-binding protein [Deltaproteobacteria bacterium]|nr:metal ABC transporter substrate-binding protein [Deltaproteobacteria bacterium]
MNLTLALAALTLAKLTVVTTTQDPAAITRAIGGDRVDVTALCKGYQDPHFLDAKPSYMLALNKADLVEAIGLEFEIGWLPSLLNGARNARVTPGNPGYLDLSTLVRPLDVMPNADRAGGDVHAFGNPHYWLDPENGRLMARGIAARLSSLDPAGAATYAANLKAFEATLDVKQAAWSKAMAPLAGQPIVTFHRSWTYFAARYGLKVVAFVEPKPGSQPTAQHTIEVINIVREQNAKVLLMENFYDRRSPDQIAAHSGAKVVFVPSMVAGTDKVTSYFDLFDVVVGAVVAAGAPSP